MKFQEFLDYFKANSRKKLYFSDSFINDFVSNGLEMFLFHSPQEEMSYINKTEKVLLNVPKYPIPDNFEKIKSLIGNYSSKFPFVTYFTYEPRKKFYIANIICEKADLFEVMPNLYDDDISVNYVVGFSKEKEFEFLALWKTIITLGNTIGLIGYKIYNTDIVNVHDTCKYLDLHLMNRKDDLVHFCGNIVRRDNDPYKIIQARNTIEQIINNGKFENELNLYMTLANGIMEPIQQQYIKMFEYVKCNNNNNYIKNYCNEIYNDLVVNHAIPTKWKHEAQMFDLIVANFPDARFQYYAEWIAPQNYDVYIPSIRTAFEFQGLQHYESVDFFGGDVALKKRNELDNRKRMISENENIRLIEWKYDEPIMKKILDEKLK